MSEHDARPVRLHIAHDGGGGSEQWLRDFIAADGADGNLILRSFSYGPATGNGIVLHRPGEDDAPIATWTFSEPIDGVALDHAEYRAILESVIAGYGVGTLIVSSLIGHCLDVLATKLPTVVVTHDYFPYCPNITPFQGTACEACSGRGEGDCRGGDPGLDPFPAFSAAERAAVRTRYVELVTRTHVTMVTPTRCVADILVAMNPAFAAASFVTIPHGYGRPLSRLQDGYRGEGRMRVVVLGRLSIAKGSNLLAAAMARITRFADVYLLGCQELGEAYRYTDHVHLISDYEPAELPGHMAAIDPHVGVLASVWPETFSYTLSELMMLGIPPVATRLGAFAERIREGEDGYLFAPRPDALVDVLGALDADREALARVSRNLRGYRPRSAHEMVADYQRIATPGIVDPAPAKELAAAPGQSSNTMTLASMWKEVKRLHIALSAVNEARQREQRERAALQGAAEALGKELQQAQRELAERRRQSDELSGLLHARNMQIQELHASTSWRISAPVRMLGGFGRKLRIAAKGGRILLERPSALPSQVAALFRAWRHEGVHGIKRFLVSLQPNETYAKAWADYRRSFGNTVRPAVLEAIAAMAERPVVSVIVPTFNTPERMLREMLESVLAQLYPDWELCVSDDGSTEPHVARILREYAARDRRIRLHFEAANRGVSHASNRALDMATGSMVALLDHDDLLEEQALFRVAQSALEDRPDMLYSDEALITPDGAIRQFVFRPAFSPEYLRGHPYIVHLVAFRAALLREIGGFDEGLRISQDYDLILRASHAARTIVHIPEILYLWRTHVDSAGHRRMHEVMQVSSSILRKDLDRRKVAGTVQEGPGFNLFDVRYALRAGLRVAIVIPTRNHGEMLRQCIDSIVATVHDVAFDIIVIDHESDEPRTRDYLAEIASRHRVMRYEGAFNFSAMNNWAVAKDAGDHSHYLFCNNDIQAIEDGWLERMLELGQQPSVGIVGARLLYPDRRTIQHAGVCLGAFRAAEHYGKFLRLPDQGIDPGYQCNLAVNHEVSAVTAACMLIRRDAFEAVGGFDPAIRVGFGDVDLCLRVVGKGYRVIYCAYATLVHHESYTRGTSASDSHPEDTARFRKKWSDALASGDPYYNPGLALNSTTWAIQLPLRPDFRPARRVVTQDATPGRGATIGGAAG